MTVFSFFSMNIYYELKYIFEKKAVGQMLVTFEGDVIKTWGFYRWIETGMVRDNVGKSGRQVQFIIANVQTSNLSRFPFPRTMFELVFQIVKMIA